MPKNLNIFAGPGQVTLFDSTNQYLFMGRAGSIEIKEKSYTHKNIKRQLIRYDREYTFKARFYETDPTMIAALETRISYAQNIHIVGAECAIKIMGVTYTYELERSYGKEDPHMIELEASWNSADDLEMWVNLLLIDTDIEFKFENFTGGIADGWNAVGYDTANEDTSSFRSGSSQLINFFPDAGHYFFSDYFYLSFAQPVRLTASIYASKISGTADVGVGFIVRYTDNSEDTFRGTWANSSIGGNTRLYHSATVVPPSGKIVKEIRFSMTFEDGEGLIIELDDAQIELGPLSNFRED